MLYGYKKLIFHKKNFTIRLILTISFFFLMAGLGIILSHLLMLREADKDVRDRLAHAIASLDGTLTHAAQAAELAVPFLGKPCDDTTLTGIRTIVATVPDVRTVNFVRHDQIYCTSVFGNRTFKVNSSEYGNGSLTLLGGNPLSPSQALAVYSLLRPPRYAVLIGIDGYYLYSVLRVLEGPSRFFMNIGGSYLSHDGQVTASVKNFAHVWATSKKYGYTILASRPDVSVRRLFHSDERHLVIIVLTVSMLLTFLFRNYLLYRDTLEFMLRRAIKRKQFMPYIQPIVDGESEVVGGEVLVRWVHPRLGFIPPDSFIAVAEQSGLIKDITALCFTGVVRQLRIHGTSLPEDLSICFNISDADFQDNDIVGLCEDFRQQLKHLRLVLEITERRAVEKTRQTTAVTWRLRLAGVDFSLDDFGTGHANFSYLRQFRPRYIKVDKMFTSAINTDMDSASVISSMVGLAKEFNCTTIAEGVEDYAQFKTLQKLGVMLFQGYLFDRPMPVNEFISRVSSQKCSSGLTPRQ